MNGQVMWRAIRRWWLLSPILLWGAFSPCAWATIAFVQANSFDPQTSQGAVSVTFSSAQTAGDLNVVVVGWSDFSSSQVISVADSKGNSYTQVATPVVSPP